ncbi:MAG: hypothetical protein AAF916_06955 [Planctomycetota bacterium]
MNTLQPHTGEGNNLADDVCSLITVGTDGRVAVVLPKFTATIGLPPGNVGIFDQAKPEDVVPGRIVRVTFDDGGVPRTIFGIAQPLDAPFSRHAIEVVVSLPRPVRRRIPLAQVTRLEVLDTVVARDTIAGVPWA